MTDRGIDVYPDAINPVNSADSNAAPKFFSWGYQNGKEMASDLLYVPMPDGVVALIEKSWKENIKGAAL